MEKIAYVVIIAVGITLGLTAIFLPSSPLFLLKLLGLSFFGIPSSAFEFTTSDLIAFMVVTAFGFDIFKWIREEM